MSSQRDAFGVASDPPVQKDTHLAAGMLAESRGQLAEAAQQYELALKQDPRDLKGLYRLGIVRTQLREEVAALAAWTKYLEVTDNDASAYANLGVCYDLFGRHDKAAEAFKSGIAKDPTNEGCRVNYGLMLARLGRPDEAVAEMATVLKPAQVQYNLASAHEQMGRRAEARAAFGRALSLQPDFPAARLRYEALAESPSSTTRPTR